MKRVSTIISIGWRRRYLTAVALALAAMCAFYVSSALADAGNPILGTIKATVVPDATGNGVTVYVRGQWNWLTHNSDCNFDRAGTGVGMIWNDPNSPGYTVTKGSISAGVGVQSSTDGNAQDQMVHPVDRGNVPQGYINGTWTSTTQGYTTNTLGDYPSGQQFVDPGNETNPSPNAYASWKGGCGREPLSSTGPAGSAGLGAEGVNSPCAGGGSCANHPWGSWGYEKNGGKGYKHHYASINDVTTVCVNFYDVHGGGKFNSGKFQLVNGAKEITVNGNTDNSIQTNAFNVNQGANCVSPPKTHLVTNASGPVTIGVDTYSISDTATLSNASSNATGSITFKLYGPFDLNTDPSTDSCVDANVVTTLGPVPIGSPDSSGNYVVSSGSYTPTAAGRYQWIASYSGDTTNVPASTNCRESGEQSVVNKHPSTVPTGQKVVISDFAKVAPTTGTGTPTGTVTFQLFKEPSSNCIANKIYDSGPVQLDANGLASTNGAATQPPTLKDNATYSWLVSYSGDSTFGKSSSSCGTEQLTISGNTPGVDP